MTEKKSKGNSRSSAARRMTERNAKAEADSLAGQAGGSGGFAVLAEELLCH
jgi:hypothetical protein